MQNLFVSLLALTASIGACTPASSETSMPGVDSQAPAIAANTAPLEQEKRLTLAEGGFSFALPSGWNYTLKEGTYTLSKAGEEVEITISAHTSASLQEIMDEGAAPISNPETDTYLNPALKTYGTDGVHLSMNGKAGGRVISIETISRVAKGGGGPVFAATTYGGKATAYLPLLQQLAASTQFIAPTANSQTANWQQRLNGKLLVYLKTEGGGTTRIQLELQTSGQFLYIYESSYLSGGASTLSYADTDKDYGNWKIAQRGGQTLLIATSTKSGQKAEFVLKNGANSSEVYLDEKRYFIKE